MRGSKGDYQCKTFTSGPWSKAFAYKGMCAQATSDLLLGRRKAIPAVIHEFSYLEPPKLLLRNCTLAFEAGWKWGCPVGLNSFPFSWCFPGAFLLPRECLQKSPSGDEQSDVRALIFSPIFVFLNVLRAALRPTPRPQTRRPAWFFVGPFGHDTVYACVWAQNIAQVLDWWTERPCTFVVFWIDSPFYWSADSKERLEKARAGIT